MSRRAALPLLAAALLAGGCALEGGRIALVEDNDVFNLGRGFDTDQDYTQGSVLAATLSDEDTPEWARDAAKALPLFADDARVNLGILLGQELHTPVDIFADPPDPGDRPYAGWLYAGMALEGRRFDGDPLRRRDRMDLLEVDLGVVGPSALGEFAQNTTHRVLGLDEAEGWEHQLKDEPGIQASWTRRWRALSGDLGSRWGADLLPGFRARAGTIHVDGTVEALGRVGWNLPRDFGPMPVDGTGLEKGAPEAPPWFAVAGSLGARGVLHDVFLHGGTFRDGPRVTNTNLVVETSLGLAVGWGPLQIQWTQNFTGPTFREDRRYHSYTTFMISLGWSP